MRNGHRVFATLAILCSLPAIGGGSRGPASYLDSDSYVPPLQCFGDPVTQMKLPQVSDENRMQYSGLCYSWATANIVEAALFRRSGSFVSLPKVLPAVAHCSMRNDSVEDMRYRLQESVNDAASKHSRYREISPAAGGITRKALQDFLALGQVVKNSQEMERKTTRYLEDLERLTTEYGVDLLRQLPKRQKLERDMSRLERNIEVLENQIEALEAQIFLDQSIAKQNPDDVLNAQISENELELARQQEELDNKKSLASDYFDQILAIRRKIETIAEAKAIEACDKGRCFVDDVKRMAYTHPEKNVSLIGLRARELDFDRDEERLANTCESSFIEHGVEEIMGSLCLGIPVLVSVNVQYLMDKREGEFVSGGSEGGHAVVIEGIETADGKQYFQARDSGGEDKYSYLAVENVCKVYSAVQVYLTQKLDGEPMSEGIATLNDPSNYPLIKAEKAAKKMQNIRVKKNWLEITAD